MLVTVVLNLGSIIFLEVNIFVGCLPKPGIFFLISFSGMRFVLIDSLRIIYVGSLYRNSLSQHVFCQTMAEEIQIKT